MLGFPPISGEMSEGQRGREVTALPAAPLDGRFVPRAAGFRRNDDRFAMMSRIAREDRSS